jgi:hypothetical protein
MPQHYDDVHDTDPRRDRREDIPPWADLEAWLAVRQAAKLVHYQDPSSGRITPMKEWQSRHAPSLGARARSILNNLLFPPSYITKCEEALGLYLSDIQMADRPGFWRSRRSNAPAVFKGVRHFG